MEATCPDVDPTVPIAIWGYATGRTLVRSLEGMDELTGKGSMDSIRGLQDEGVAMLLPGVSVDGTGPTLPLVSTTKVQQFVDGQWEVGE
ncbi:hypothetical protein [Nocardia vaccinii]|uniref:hypothetical protein n=1 Tax=Nocardia vaccinii TaxID=1822 RepID=UPI0008377819|nr:hypothetical protein [Nocardia vaccinii]